MLGKEERDALNKYSLTLKAVGWYENGVVKEEAALAAATKEVGERQNHLSDLKAALAAQRLLLEEDRAKLEEVLDTSTDPAIRYDPDRFSSRDG
jgi:hypothetical protein